LNNNLKRGYVLRYRYLKLVLGLYPLVVSLLPDEWLGHSIVGWLSASLSLIVPSERTHWDTVIGGSSHELDSADLGELTSSLLAWLTRGDALLLGVVDLGALLLRLDAVVVVLLVSIWALHSAMAASDSHEEFVALGLVGGWGDLLAGSLSVGLLASLLGWSELEFAFNDLLLDSLREVVEKSEKGLDIVVSLDSESIDGEDLLDTGVFLALGEGTGDY
jgi:hypothetical protein